MAWVRWRIFPLFSVGVGISPFHSWNPQESVSSGWPPHLTGLRFLTAASDLLKTKWGVACGQVDVEESGCRVLRETHGKVTSAGAGPAVGF